jgi:hypothetical protein
MTHLIPYHAVMSDYPGHEFGVTVNATSKAEAYDALSENYPESRCLQLESPDESDARENAIWERAARELDGDYGDEYPDHY